MAELIILEGGGCEADCCAAGPHVEVIRMNLYCWPCRTVHAFTMDEVEQIVYSLGAAEILAYDSGYQDAEDQAERARPPDGPSACLRTALRDAGNPEVFAEHVEQGMECRERSEAVEELPAGEALDAERRGDGLTADAATSGWSAAWADRDSR